MVVADAGHRLNRARRARGVRAERIQNEIEQWGSYVPTGRRQHARGLRQGRFSWPPTCRANTTGAIVPVDGGYLAQVSIDV